MLKSKISVNNSGKRIAIIGAGIGGLTTALALQQKGVAPEVYEGARELKPAGAGIVLANNAMQIYDELGLRLQIEGAGQKISQMVIADSQLKALYKMDLRPFEEKYGVYNVAVHRADLQNILLKAVNPDRVHCGKKLVNLRRREEDWILDFEDGSSARCDWLIGADGIRSTVRDTTIRRGKIRGAGQVCWRGVCRVKANSQDSCEAVEAWGRGLRFGVVEIGEESVYWFAVASEGIWKRKSGKWQDLFGDFHPEVRDLIERTPMQNVRFDYLADLRPLRKWYGDSVCLVGDAAHATTPNMGQGACQAIEDAYCLSRLYDPEKSLTALFETYQNLRSAKTRYIVRSSRWAGQIAHLEKSVFIRMRNALLRRLPDSVRNKQLDRIFELTCPEGEAM